MRTWVKQGRHRIVGATVALLAAVALCVPVPAMAWKATQPTWHMMRIEREPGDVGSAVVYWVETSTSVSSAQRADGSFDSTASGKPFDAATHTVHQILFDADSNSIEIPTQYNGNLVVTPSGRYFLWQTGVTRTALSDANGGIITTLPVKAQLASPSGQLYDDSYAVPTAVMAVNEAVVIDTETTGPFAVSSMPTVTASIDASSGSLGVVLGGVTDTGVLGLMGLSAVCLGVVFADRWRVRRRGRSA